jgi:Ca-activated chloride channel family protein
VSFVVNGRRFFVAFMVIVTIAAAAARTQEPQLPPLAIAITSPLGRSGLSGPIRIVARVTTAKPDVVLSPVQFYVDGTLIGEDKDGPPYAVQWVDANPFEPREIVVQVADGAGLTARDSVKLVPLELRDKATVSSVLLEPLVVDEKGRSVGGLTAADFRVFEDGVLQKLDLASSETVPATYTLLIDSSQSLSNRVEFVREAARRLPARLRQVDQVIVAPFARELGAITGPTRDADTIAGAIDAIQAGGGTAIVDSLASAASQLQAIPGRHVIVLLTDGYDEHSAKNGVESALDALKATHVTVYSIGIGGVAGISMNGQDLLKRIAHETGGRAFFPAREFQLTEVHGLIAEDVQQRYLLTYTPSNQRFDGMWREITVATSDPARTVRVRPGYFAPSPPPIRPQLELTIRDTNRQFVDVSAADLEVLEDGVPQAIEVFQEAVAPVSFVLVLDASGSMRRDAEAVKEAARAFVEALPRLDKLSVALFADKVDIAHDLTTLRQWSLDAIGKYTANGGTALYDALVTALQRLKTVDGRRVVVALTDGRDEDNPGTGPGSTHTYDDVRATLKSTEATVFTIGLGPNVDRVKLEEVAQLSNGEAYFPENVSALGAEYRRILENLRRRYVISYTSTNKAYDGAWRDVIIRSKIPGIVIDSKGGYKAPDTYK